MKKIVFSAITIGLLVGSSCKKSSTTTNTPTDSYMSMTTGSTWNYKLTNNPSSTPAVSNYTVASTGRDTSANGKTYRIFSNTAGTSQLFNITGTDYYTFMQLPAQFNVPPIEVLYLKGNAAINTTWSQSFPITVASLPLTLTMNNKIVQTGMSKTVNGIAYNNVVDVETTLSIAGIPIFVTYGLFSNIHYYYAPKVGQIESYTKIDLTYTVPGSPAQAINFEEKRELQSATIL